MKGPYYEHGGVTMLRGNALPVLRGMEAGGVQCCITSPPYWGLRDYGTGEWVGGEASCDHIQNRGNQEKYQTGQRADRSHPGVVPYKDVCGRCGARREDEQIGLERTPGEYVAKLVEVFREVRRVLRDDGTLWLNLGDSYATGAGKVGEHPGGGKQGEQWAGRHPGRVTQRGLVDRDDARGRGTSKRCDGRGGHEYYGPMTQPNRLPVPGLKPKDLCGIPWRVAFALQADGWYLRSDICWAKPAPMPESVTDRPTRSHEFIFLLSKSAKYYYDADAIKEPAVSDHASGNGYKRDARLSYDGRGSDEPWVPSRPSAPKGSFNGKTEAMADTGRNAFRAVTEYRNKRDVWTVNTDPFPEAHFATFPPALILPCVLAGCPEGGVILDPFFGAGTTGLVAKENGRRCIGIELKEEYCEIAAKRLAQEVLPLVEPGPPAEQRDADEWVERSLGREP